MFPPGFSGLRGPQTPIFGPDAEVCIDSDQFVQPFFLCEPPEQVRFFMVLFCLSAAAGLILHHGSASRYYSWFAQANMPHNKVRGMAYNACKAYGIFPIPELSIPGFHVVGWCLVGSILLACHPGLAPRFFLFLSIPLYFLYFGQLFCESKHGGHGSLLLPSVFLLLALSGGPRSTPWSLVYVKIFLGIIYVAGALSKLGVSVWFGQRWCGSTMQAYLIDAMWSRPHRRSWVRAIQGFCVKRWYICSFLALSGLGFELCWLPVYMLGGHWGATIAGAVAFSFHLGVDVLQGLDFKPFWCPIFWVFLPDVQAILTGVPEAPWTEVVAQGFEEEPFRSSLSALYLLVQIVVSLGFFDIQDKECLPFTCCPMFALPRNMFGDETRAGVMTDFNLRDGGWMDMAYNFSPWHKKMPLDQASMNELPGKMMVWMNSEKYSDVIAHFLREEALGQELLMQANFEVSPKLSEAISQFLKFLGDCNAEDWANSEKVQEALDMQEHCQQLFREDALLARSSESEADGDLKKPLTRAVDRSTGALLSFFGLLK
mmetsp:Transcript_63/g.126  ORF Transcript_63/g.126 Transcript_63/m.126 type:complete len:542 (-) Transcript_63:350-1975(-)